MNVIRFAFFLFFLVFASVIFPSFYAFSTDYEIINLQGRVLENESLISSAKKVLDDGYLRTFRDSYVTLSNGKYFIKIYPYTKVKLTNKELNLEYGKVSFSKKNSFVEIHFLIFPRPAQGRVAKILLLIDTEDKDEENSNLKSLVYGENYRRNIRLYVDGRNLYSGFIPFDVSLDPGRYFLYVEFKAGGVSSVLKYPFYLQNLKAERGLVKLQEEDLEVLKSSHEKKIQIEELSRILSQPNEKKLWKERFIYPVNEVKIISKFGKKRTYLFNRKYMFTSFHRGIDLKAYRDQEVYSPNDGIVVLARRRITTGNTVVIDHGRGVFSLLFHLNTILVEEGERVNKGVIIGTAGDTGFAAGVHVHWSVVVDGIYVNPEDWVRIRY